MSTWGRFKILRNKQLLKTNVIKGINIALILLTLNLLSINFLIVESSFMQLLSVYLLIGVMIFNIPFKKMGKLLISKKHEKTSFYKTLLGLILIVFSFLLFFFTKSQMFWLVSIPIMISGLDLALQGIKIKRRELHILSVASFIYAMFFIMVQSIPILWYLIQKFSLSFSNLIGSLISKPLLLGPSTSGLWILIVFFLFSFGVFISTNSNKRRFILNIFGLAISWIIYLIILGFSELKIGSDILNFQYLIFFFCLITTFLYLSKIKLKANLWEPRIKDIKYKKIVKNGAVLALLLLLISSIILTSFPGEGASNKNTKKNVLFYGQNMFGSWDVPEYGKYGKLASGMFGILPHYVKNLGYNTKIIVSNKELFLNGSLPLVYENISRYVNITDYSTIKESSLITSEILSDVDIFVIISLKESFSSSELKIIWDFVEKGGSLLVMGDHTDIGGMRTPLNQLLEPFGISYRFDSGLPIEANFRRGPCFHMMHHPITHELEIDDIQISVGATLDINHQAFPIILGKYDLSDWGDYSNVDRAYLGDYKYNPGEQIGDVILVAGAYYGDGKVVVFGDTSSFQNSALPYSLPLINNIFSYLSSSRTGMTKSIQIVASLILLISAFVLYSRARKNKIPFILFPLALCLSLIICAIANPIIIEKNEITGNIAYIDISHNERFSIRQFEDDSMSGFMLNLMRNVYLPIILKDFSTEKIDNCEMIIFNAPTKAFSYDEVNYLKQYMYNGGLVILSAGYEDKDPSMPLLEEFGLDINDIPLGPVPYVEENPEEFQKEPKLVNSWPIIGKIEIVDDVEMKDLVFENGKTYSVYSAEIIGDLYILMTFTRHGDGGLLFISDSEFLLDRNIESKEDYWPGNIQFIYHIIDVMKQKGVLE